MRRVIASAMLDLPVSFRRPLLCLLLGLLTALMAPGCVQEPEVDFATESKPPTVQVINPPVRTIMRIVGQPSFIEAYDARRCFRK